MYKQLTSMQRPQTLSLLLRKPQEKRVCTLLASANLHYVVRCGARVASWVNMPDSRHTIKAMEWRKRSTDNVIATRSLCMVLTKNSTKYPERLSLTRRHRRSATWDWRVSTQLQRPHTSIIAVCSTSLWAGQQTHSPNLSIQRQRFSRVLWEGWQG